MTPDPITFLYERLTEAREQLVAAGIAPAAAAIDVDLFARTILGWDRARVLTARTEPAPAALEPRFSEWLLRRAHREPSAYIVGNREFWGLDFRVTSDVLIPRPESEFIVEESLAALATMEWPSSRLADIGTGSGCLAISLLHEIADAHVTATDVSRPALAVARDNARRHRVDQRVTFVETSFLDGISGPFDLIAANPPYVKEGDKPALARDVRHEPDVALFGGESGLKGVEAVLDAATRTLANGGWLVMEFGFGQEDDVRRLVAARPSLRIDRVRADLQQIPRTAVIQRQ
jgi:release factor glutamine methyltransferase